MRSPAVGLTVEVSHRIICLVQSVNDLPFDFLGDQVEQTTCLLQFVNDLPFNFRRIISIKTPLSSVLLTSIISVRRSTTSGSAETEVKSFEIFAIEDIGIFVAKLSSTLKDLHVVCSPAVGLIVEISHHMRSICLQTSNHMFASICQ